MAPSSRRHSSESRSEDEAFRSGSDSERGSRDEKHPNWASSRAKAVRYRRDRRRSPSREGNRYSEENQGEKSREDKADVRREGARRNSDEEIGARRSRMEGDDVPFVAEGPFVQQLVAAFYQCLNGCVGLVLKGNPISLSSLEELLQNSIRNVEIGGGSALVPALKRVVDGFRSAAEEWRSLRAACSAHLAEEAEAQREAARKALEALSEEVTRLQARADQISNAREAKSLAKKTAENAILNARTMAVWAQKIIAEQRPKVNLLEEEVAKLFQEQNHVDLAIAEKKMAVAAAEAQLANSAAKSSQAREALQKQLAASEAEMKALVLQ